MSAKNYGYGCVCVCVCVCNTENSNYVYSVCISCPGAEILKVLL
jgi:hypothetical protein